MSRVRQSLLLFSTFDNKAMSRMYAKKKGWQETKKNIVLDNVTISNKLRAVQEDAQRDKAEKAMSKKY